MLSVLALAALAQPALADPGAADAAAVLKEMEQMTGFVPAFVHSMPAALLPSWWQATKDLDMNPRTALDSKTKELIGLAVAAQIPCDYCVEFHTQAAHAAGATDEQIREAVGMAAITRETSTLLNGMQIDRVQFRKDVERLLRGPHPKK
jgi:AhpD family alkylhydroperoxidase